MCHTITRNVCEGCSAQIGDAVIREVACFAAVFRPAWGSGVSQIEQHRAKRYRRTKGLCEACEAAAAAAAAASAEVDAEAEVEAEVGKGDERAEVVSSDAAKAVPAEAKPAPKQGTASETKE